MCNSCDELPGTMRIEGFDLSDFLLCDRCWNTYLAKVRVDDFFPHD